MAGGHDAACLIGDRPIDACGDFGRVSRRGQLFGLAGAEQRFALDIGAHDDGAGHRRDMRRQRPRKPRLAGAGQAADGDASRRRWIDRTLREIEIGARRLGDLVALVRCGALQPRRRDLGADRGPHRQEERQRRQRVEIFVPVRFGKIAVEHDIGRLRQLALEQVHQQKGEIVEHVARGDDVAELDGVEQHRPAVDQRDIAEMKIAVDAANQPAPAALAQQRHDASVVGAASRGERFDFARPERSRGARQTPRHARRCRSRAP